MAEEMDGREVLQPQNIDYDAKLRYEREREKDAQRQTLTRTDNDSPHTLGDLWRSWLYSPAQISKANARISQSPDKYDPNAGKGQLFKSILLDWVDGLERGGQGKDRTR